MSAQPLFYISSRQRKKLYASETFIWDRSGTLLVEKRALSKEAIPHLHNMVTIAEKLSAHKAFSKKVEVLKPKLTKTGIEYLFINGHSPESSLLDSLLEGKMSESNELDTVFSAIDSLDTVKTDPSKSADFLRYFGSSFRGVQDCIEPGLLDLNLDNFLVDDKTGKWVLIDYEWCFDFPLPVDLLKFRVLWFFLKRHQEIIEYNKKKLTPFLFDDTVLVPKIIYTKYEQLFSCYSDFAKAESTFQKVVNGVFASAHQAGSSQFLPIDVNEPIGYDATIKRSLDSKLSSLKTELSHAKSSLRDTSKELDLIKNSKSYKLSTKLSKILRHFS